MIDLNVQRFSSTRTTPRRALRLIGYGVATVAVAVVFASSGVASEAGDTRTSQSRVVWTGNYESGDFSQWERVVREDESPGTARIVTNPVAQGRFAARFVLGAQTAYSGSRIEAHQPDTAASGGYYGSETWYRWAEFVPSSSRFAPHATFNNLIQWKQHAPCSGATLSVNGLARPVRLFLHVRGGEILTYDEGCHFRDERSFDLGPLPRDRWLRFRLHVKWSADPNEGFVELWLNGARKIKLTRVVTAPPGVDHYVRQGIYRFRCSCRTVVYGDSMTITQVSP